MKDKLKLLGIIVAVAIIGFSTTGCPTSADTENDYINGGGNDPGGGNVGGGGGDNVSGGGGGNVGGGGPVTSAQLRTIDIVGAQALMIAPRGTVGGARGATEIEAFSEPGNALFKQIDGGEWVEVSMLDADGNDLQLDPPDRIMDLTDRWMLMRFAAGQYTEREYCTCCGDIYWDNWRWRDEKDHLACKETGAVFDVSGIHVWSVAYQNPWGSGTYHGQPVVREDRNGNLYMLIRAGGHGNRQIIRISTGATHGTATNITPATIDVRQFAADANGNIMFDVGTHFMARTAAGVSLPLQLHPSLASGRNGTLFTGLSGNIYFLVNESELVPTYSWTEWRWCDEKQEQYEYRRHYHNVERWDLLAYRVEIRGATIGNIIFTPIEIDGADEIDTRIRCCCNMGTPNGMFHFPEKIVLLSSEGSWGESFMVNWPRNGSPSVVRRDLGISSTHRLGNDTLSASADEIFIRTGNGNYRLIALDPMTGDTRDVIPQNTFARLFNHEVTADGFVTLDVLTFGLNRNLVQILPGGHIETLRVNLHEEETITLVRLR